MSVPGSRHHGSSHFSPWPGGSAWQLGPSAGAWIYDAWGFHMLNMACFLFTMCGVLGALLTPAILRDREVPREHPAEQRGNALGAEEVIRRFRRCRSDGFDLCQHLRAVAADFVLLTVLQRIGVSLGLIGLLLSTIGVSSLVVRFFLPAVIRRFGLIKPLIWSTWIAIIGVAMTPLSSNIAFLAIGRHLAQGLQLELLSY